MPALPDEKIRVFGARQHNLQNLDLEIPRTALRWHVHDYATPTARLDELRDERVLTVPELETLAHVDGTRTVQSVVRLGPLDPAAAARLLWTLGAMSAIALGPEVHDIATSPRIGITKCADWPLRFFVRGNRFVSGPRNH